MANQKLKKKIFKKFGSYQELADKSNISIKTISDTANDKRKPRPMTVLKITEALECSAKDIDLKY